MKRIILLIVSPIALLLGLWQMWSGLVEIFPSIRQDHQISAAAADAGKAASDLNSLAKDAFETGRPPRQTDPGVKSLLDRVFGTDVLARRTVGESDLGATADWSMAVVKAGAVYILAGTGISDFSKMTNDPKLPERINQNVVAFAPEMGRYFDAQLAVMGGMLDAINASMAGGKTSNAKVESGLEKVRRGITATLTGALSTVATGGLSDEWRRARLPALKAAAPKAAKLLLGDQCHAVRDAAVQAAGMLSNATLQAELRSIGGSLQCQP
jgi:hypothetical protein